MHQIVSRLQRKGRYLITGSVKPAKPKKGTIAKDFIASFLPEDPIIIEAGAHNGADTMRMARLWPKGTIHAFEPVPELFDSLGARTSGLKNVRTYPLALSDRTGVAKMFISSGARDRSRGTGASSLLPPKEHLAQYPGILFQTQIDVQTTTLDDWAEKQAVERVDFLWLDLQGGELQALKAASGILKSVRAIHTEVSLKELYQGSPLYADIREWLIQHGFRVEREELPWPAEGNVLFVLS